MAKSPTPALLQGTLDLLILHSLGRGPLHGYAIAQTIHLLSDEVLKVEEGSLYPALYRLELDGAISSNWGLSENNRKAKYYEITRRGRKLTARTANVGTAFDRCRPRTCEAFSMIRRLFLKLSHRRRLERELDAELAFHREMSTAGGNPIPLGNTGLLKEQAFDLWRFNGIENFGCDIRYSIRAHRKSPGFVLTVLLSRLGNRREHDHVFAGH